ncbi:hypothetical protein GCM10023189_23120 [Nibrella saemangeumensis]|uniref:NIPSNAP domain-containing protein n=1 Tax=Nibrella saemangeumensis TaxID=1084526 RepID=A0ABP8MW63_9BACT
MIVVRDIFQIEPDQMKLAKELAKQSRQIEDRLGHRTARILTDCVGEYYTLITESEFDSLAEYETAIKAVIADPEWQQFYPQFRRLMRSGRREIFTILE